jgi:hypothetical protein
MMKWDEDESLNNYQFDEDLGWYEEEYHAEDWTTRLYTTNNLMKTRDIVRRSDLTTLLSGVNCIRYGWH